MKSNMKFLCSYRGKMLARPFDGRITYVGGTTRLISVPRDITFQELKKKLGGISADGTDVVLKYQLIPGGELDDDGALVSVVCDEDLRHMLEVHDWRSGVLSSGRGRARLMRTFLFPYAPLFNRADLADAPYPLDQRFIDVINGSSSFGNSLEQLYADVMNGVGRHHSSSMSYAIRDPLKRCCIDAVNGHRNHGTLSTTCDPLTQRCMDAVNGVVRSCNHRSGSSFTCPWPGPACKICSLSDEVDVGLGDAYGPFSPRNPLFSTLW